MRLPCQGCFAPQSRHALDRANRYMIIISQARMNIYVITHNILQLQALSDVLSLLNFLISSGARSPDICSLFRSSEVPVRLTVLLFLFQLFYSFQILGSLILPILQQDVHCISGPVSWPDDYHLYFICYIN